MCVCVCEIRLRKILFSSCGQSVALLPGNAVFKLHVANIDDLTSFYELVHKFHFLRILERM